MLRMAQVQYIKDLYENEEKSLREISRITGHSFETVQKYAQKENWSETISRILSQRVIRCWGSSFLLWTAGWKQIARCQESSGIQPGDFSVAYGTSTDLQAATPA